MTDLIGGTDGMGDPGSDAWARVTGMATATVLIAEARTRSAADRERGDQRRRRGEAAAGHLDRARQAAAPSRREPGQRIPDSRTLLQLWRQAAAADRDPGAAARMAAADRYLRVAEPELMGSYDTALRDGRQPLPAMAAALRTSRPNPDPPTIMPAAAGWTGGYPDGRHGISRSPSPEQTAPQQVPPAPSPAGRGRWQRLASTLTRKGPRR